MMSREFNRYEELIGREMYEYYRANRKFKSKGLNQYNLWKKAIGGFMSELRDVSIETDGGVYLEGLFHIGFKNVKTINKRVSLLNKEEVTFRDFTIVFDDERINNKYTHTYNREVIKPKLKKYNFNNEYVKYRTKVLKDRWTT